VRISVLAFLFLPGGNFPFACSGATVSPRTSKGAPTAPERAKDQTYDEQEKFAVMLFQQNHYLEALPVFQDLAKRNPVDPEVFLVTEPA
jgi:hypothetical protein